MKPTPAYKKYVSKLIKYMREELLLHEYDFTLKFAEQSKEDKEDVLATISSDTKYLTAIITFYPRLQTAFKRQDGYYIFEAITHELCHIFTEPLYLLALPATADNQSDALEEVRERQTQRITNAIITRIPKSVYIIKKKTNGAKKHVRKVLPRRK